MEKPPKVTKIHIVIRNSTESQDFKLEKRWRTIGEDNPVLSAFVGVDILPPRIGEGLIMAMQKYHATQFFAMMAISVSKATKNDLLTSVAVRFATSPGQGESENRMQSGEMSSHPASSFLAKKAMEISPCATGTTSGCRSRNGREKSTTDGLDRGVRVSKGTEMVSRGPKGYFGQAGKGIHSME